jgi:hypothetical protein
MVLRFMISSLCFHPPPDVRLTRSRLFRRLAASGRYYFYRSIPPATLYQCQDATNTSDSRPIKELYLPPSCATEPSGANSPLRQRRR